MPSQRANTLNVSVWLVAAAVLGANYRAPSDSDTEYLVYSAAINRYTADDRGPVSIWSRSDTVCGRVDGRSWGEGLALQAEILDDFLAVGPHPIEARFDLRLPFRVVSPGDNGWASCSLSPIGFNRAHSQALVVITPRCGFGGYLYGRLQPHAYRVDWRGGSWEVAREMEIPSGPAKY